MSISNRASFKLLRPATVDDTQTKTGLLGWEYKKMNQEKDETDEAVEEDRDLVC